MWSSHRYGTLQGGRVGVDALSFLGVTEGFSLLMKYEAYQMFAHGVIKRAKLSSGTLDDVDTADGEGRVPCLGFDGIFEEVRVGCES